MQIYDTRHTLKKLCSTLRIATTLILARTFGHYEHSEFNGEFNLAKYKYHGKYWAFPTSPYEQ
jgi:hypothetical protein